MNTTRIAKDRLLRMCAKLTKGHVLYKHEEAAKYTVVRCAPSSTTLTICGRSFPTGTWKPG